jgi:hypothetical protein
MCIWDFAWIQVANMNRRLTRRLCYVTALRHLSRSSLDNHCVFESLKAGFSAVLHDIYSCLEVQSVLHFVRGFRLAIAQCEIEDAISNKPKETQAVSELFVCVWYVCIQILFFCLTVYWRSYICVCISLCIYNHMYVFIVYACMDVYIYIYVHMYVCSTYVRVNFHKLYGDW